jgi:Transcription factor WhiB
MIRELTLRSITDRQDRGCVDVDASVFYPRQRTRGAIDYAKQFCDRCPISNDCRAYASTHDLDGIWLSCRFHGWFRPGRGGQSPPRVSMAMEMSASGLWNP